MLSRVEHERFMETMKKASRHKVDGIEYVSARAVEIMLEWFTVRPKAHEING